MNIGIDGNEANIDFRVGSGVYAYQLIRHLYELDTWNNYIIYLKDSPLADMPPERSGWKYRVVGPKKLWTQFGLPLALYTQKEKLNVFFTPGHYAPRFCPFPTVISVLDLAFFGFPEYFKKDDLMQLKAWTKYSVQKAKHVLTISESTKKDVVKYYQYPTDNITVTYIGYDTETFAPVYDEERIEAVLAKYGIARPYILYLGTLQPRKNILRLVRAFHMLVAQEKYSDLGLKLVIVGKKGWLFDEIFAEVKKLGMERVVVFTGFVPDEDKCAILSGALIYTLPSLYEGFGIPVLEAMACGTPVVTSRISSLPEVTGECGVLVDPYSEKSICGGMKLLINDVPLREELRQKGLMWVKHFDWMNTARTTLKVLEEVGGGRE
jgi:glycosyltransferase involved in cell wall biosynthesis